MDKRMTVKDLAKIAGVDHSTVSRALNDSPRVSDATRRRIKGLAKKYNFQFNSTARSLSSRRTGIIGIIYPAGMDDFSSSLYTNRLFMDLRRELETYQLDGILLEAAHPVSEESNVERLIRQNKVDGFLIFHGGIKSCDYQLIRKWNLPVVQIHLRPNYYPAEGLDFFSTDNELGGRLAARHLYEIGCRRFYDISIPVCRDVSELVLSEEQASQILTETQARTAGFCNELKNLGVKHEAIIKEAIVGSFQAAHDYITSQKKLFEAGDGLFFHSDLIAFGALTAFMDSDLRVPEDVRIIGFDDSPIATLLHAGITTIHQPREIIASRAAMRISELLEQKYGGHTSGCNETAQELIEPVLKIRKTTVKEG